MLHKRLEAAHRETNLYLDVMTHDIKNAENVANLYCDLLLDTLEATTPGTHGGGSRRASAKAAAFSRTSRPSAGFTRSRPT